MSVRRSLITSISLAMVFVAPGSALAGVPDTLAPVVTITTPPNGATYQQNEVVNANFSCSDSGGSGLFSCSSTVFSGTPIDTSTVGGHTFTVMAYDVAGNSSTVQNFYSVVSDAKPDARIRRIGRTNRVGSNIYNADATGQTLNAKVKSAAGKRFVISIQNNSPTPDSFTVSATGLAASGFDISYHHGHPGSDITAAVVAGTYTTRTIAPGGIFRIRAVVVVSPPLGASGITQLVTIKSNEDPAIVDAVRFNVGTLVPCLTFC